MRDAPGVITQGRAAPASTMLSGGNAEADTEASAKTNAFSEDGVPSPAESSRFSPMGIRILIFVCLAWVIDAADSTVFSLTLPSIREEFGLSLSAMGMIASVFIGGTMIGAFVLPVIAERKGRRVGMVLCVGLFSLATGLVGVAQHLWVLTLGRLLTGAGTGAEWPIGAAYLSEVVPPARRGLAFGIMQAGYPVGYFIAGGIATLIATWGWGWRAAYLVLIIPALLCIPIFFWLKESPAWLERHVPQKRSASTEPRSRENMGRQSPAVRFVDLFRTPYRKRMSIATALHVFGAIFSYGMVVWVPSAMMTDFHVSKVEVGQFVMVAWGVGTFGYLIAGPLADRFGRRPMLVVYTLLGLLAVAILRFYLHQGGATLTMLFIPGVLIGISLGVAAIYIAYTAEILPAEVRTVGLGFAVAIGKGSALFVPAVMGVIAQSSSITTALVASTAVGCLMIPVVLFGPETAKTAIDGVNPSHAPEAKK